MILGSLSKGVFEPCTSTRSEIFFILKYIDNTKLVFLSLFLSIETICPKIWEYSSRMKKVHYRLTYVVQKHLCLSSLLTDTKL